MNQGLRFKTARDFLRYSQAQIADLVGISQNSISKIEGNKTDKPNFRYVVFLRDNGISQDWLLEEKGEMVLENSKAILNKEKVDKNQTLHIPIVHELKKENEFLKNENRTLRSELREVRAKLDSIQDALTQKFLGLELGKDKTCIISEFVNEEEKNTAVYRSIA